MKRVRVIFESIRQESQEVGSPDEHLVAIVGFVVTLGDRVYPNCQISLKQTVGTSYGEGSLEAGAPRGCPDCLNLSELRLEAAKYYREQIGPGGRGIGFGCDSNAKMVNNVILAPKMVDISIADPVNAW